MNIEENIYKININFKECVFIIIISMLVLNKKTKIKRFEWQSTPI